jgi:hypothetical protein
VLPGDNLANAFRSAAAAMADAIRIVLRPTVIAAAMVNELATARTRIQRPVLRGLGISISSLAALWGQQ